MSGEEALKVVSDERLDFAVLDVILPALTEFKFFVRVKLASPATIVLMMSAYHLVSTLRRAAKMLALGCVCTTPYKPPKASMT